MLSHDEDSPSKRLGADFTNLFYVHVHILIFSQKRCILSQPGRYSMKTTQDAHMKSKIISLTICKQVNCYITGAQLNLSGTSVSGFSSSNI